MQRKTATKLPDKLELKDLVHSLPHGLKFIHQGKIYLLMALSLKYDQNPLWIKGWDMKKSTIDIFPEGCKPILHPLSDLTKEITINGKTFVPIDMLWFDTLGTDNEAFDKDAFYNNYDFGFGFYPYKVVQKLFEWKFNVFNLPKHLWINVNDLPENPYKNEKT